MFDDDDPTSEENRADDYWSEHGDDLPADDPHTTYDDAFAAYQAADDAVVVAQADVADLPYLQRLTVLVPLYADLLGAHAAMEAASAALPRRDWLGIAGDIVGVGR